MNFSGQAIQDLPKFIPVDTPLWSFKLDSYSIDKLSQADPYTFSSQYQQCPSPAAGECSRILILNIMTSYPQTFR